MVLNVGLTWSASAVRGAATGKTASAIPCLFRAPLTRSCFSTASQPSRLYSVPRATSCLRSSSSIWTPTAARMATPLRSMGNQSWSLPQARCFSSSSLAYNQPPSTPTPKPSPASSPAPTSKPALSEDILTLPNLLTISRLLATPYIGYLVATHQFVPACTLLFVASLTDLLDGWLARRTNRYTVFGSIADPAADKALVTTMVISLAVSGMLPLSIAAIIIGRDVALVISAFIIRYRTLEPPKTFTRYFNPRLPSASVTPTQISKYNTFLQLLLLGCLTLYPILFPDQGSPGLMLTEGKEEASSPYGDAIARAKTWIDPCITALMWITAATTIWSGVGYLGGAGSAKVLAARAQTVSQKVKSSLNKPPPSSS